jgi:TonB family protein
VGKVNADVTVRVTVDPRGRVVDITSLSQADPRLVEAVRRAVQRWRFEALPENVPQMNESAAITFQFRS